MSQAVELFTSEESLDPQDRQALRQSAMNGTYQVDVQHLEQGIAEGRAAGYRLFCGAGNARTVNMGASDDLSGWGER